MGSTGTGTAATGSTRAGSSSAGSSGVGSNDAGSSGVASSDVGSSDAGSTGARSPEFRPAGAQSPIISLTDLSVHFALRGSGVARLIGRSSGAVKALDGVSLDVAPGEVVGLVGESGSGKSTLGRAVLGLAPVSGGSVRYRGREIGGLPEKKMRPLRARLQMVFQDPAAALNPTMTVGQAVSDALRVQDTAPRDRPAAVARALERVGLSPVERFSGKYPSELSGGQKQRAVIARAIALDPDLLVADEPISMLDMSVRSKILTLLQQLRADLGLSFIYITHDLASARFFCDRVAIMYLGRIVEIGPTAEIFAHPRHPYTKALLKAVPDITHRRGDLAELPRGEVPDAAQPPAGCPFHPRCPAAFDRCGWEVRDLRVMLEERWTSVGLEDYERESALVPGLETLPTGRDGIVRSPRPAQLIELLEQIRTKRPDEPFFSGLESMVATGDGVRLTFRAAQRPQLLPIVDAPSEVACYLYSDQTDLDAVQGHHVAPV